MSGHCYSHRAFGTVKGWPFSAILMGMVLGTLAFGMLCAIMIALLRLKQN
jgi:hypothetical protein